MDVRSRPRSGLMNATWMMMPRTNMAGTVTSRPMNKPMPSRTDSV